MALSPADFYAYSRATGAPVPEDPQERAQMAPEVLEFRRNQLRAQSQESNPLQSAGTAALALGAAVGAGLAARSFLRGRSNAAFEIPKSAAKSATAPITTEDLSAIQRAAGRTQATTPPPRRIPLTPEQEQRFAAAKQRSPVIRQEVAVSETVSPSMPAPGTTENAVPVDPTDRLLEELSDFQAKRKYNLETRMGRAYGSNLKKTAEQLIDQLQAAGPDLTTIQQTKAASLADQSLSAAQSGEDQMTGRMKMQLSRNEDLDLSQVELLENIAEENEALMRGQADPSQMQGYLNDDAINVAASQLSDGLPVDQAENTRRLSSQELADMAKEEMIGLRQNLEARGLRPGTQRFERALAQEWTTKYVPNAEPGSTAFRELQSQGQVDLTLPAGPIRSAVERVVEMPEEEGLPERLMRSVSNIGPGAEVTSTAAGTAIRGASPTYQTYENEPKTRQIFGSPDVLVKGAPDDVMTDFPGSYTAEMQILAQSDVPERIDPYAKKRLEGGEAGIGVYGPEVSYVPGAVGKSTGEYSKAASRQPTYVPKWMAEQQKTGFGSLTDQQLLAGAEKAKAPTIKAAFENELNRRRSSRQSIAVSEVLRRGRIEGTLLPAGRTIQGPVASAQSIFSVPESIRLASVPLKKGSI